MAFRPTYETSEDLNKETLAIKKFIASFGRKGSVNFAKLPMQYKMDFCLIDNGKIRTFVEVKCRTNKKTAYSTYIISMSKVVAAKSYSDIGINCILLVQWADQMGWIDMLNNKWDAKIGGRKDRGDWQDIEPVVHIPISEFNIVEEYNVRKVYPSKLNIEIKPAKFIAKIYDNSQLLVGSNGKLIKSETINDKLPYILGKFNSKKFLEFKKNIDLSEFNIKDFKNIIFYPSNRLDILTLDNVLIKLPENNLLKSINLAYKIINNNQFKDNSLIDLRVLNQLIIK